MVLRENLHVLAHRSDTRVGAGSWTMLEPRLEISIRRIISTGYQQNATLIVELKENNSNVTDANAVHICLAFHFFLVVPTKLVCNDIDHRLHNTISFFLGETLEKLGNLIHASSAGLLARPQLVHHWDRSR